MRYGSQRDGNQKSNNVSLRAIFSVLCHQKVNRYHRNADRVSLGMSIRSGYLRKKILGSPQDVLRPERSVGAVLAFDEYGSGFEAFGVVPQPDRDAEAHAIGG